MRDRGFLFIVACLLATASWVFWHFMAEDAFTVFSTIVLLCVALDNFRLRQKLRTLQWQLSGRSPLHLKKGGADH